MLVFEERGKLDYPEKNLSEQRSDPTTKEGGEKKIFKKILVSTLATLKREEISWKRSFNWEKLL